MYVLACRGLKLTVKGERESESEGDFVRFNDKYRLRKRRGKGERERSGYAAAKTRHQTRETQN